MNNHKDLHLGANAVKQLQGIIVCHRSCPNRAMSVPEQLILAYTKSAQLYVSKRIFAKTNDIKDKKLFRKGGVVER